MSVADQLREARALIDTPDKWTTGAFGRVSKGGEELGIQELDGATCFCAAGAVRSLQKPSQRTEVPSEPLRCLIASLPKSSGDPLDLDDERVFEFNDDPATTHADVLALFDRAIAAAESAVSP